MSTTDRLQSLAKKKLEIDYSKLQYARNWGEDEDKYWSARNRLETAYKEAYFRGDVKDICKTGIDLIDFYALYGVKDAKKI